MENDKLCEPTVWPVGAHEEFRCRCDKFSK
jgi:hypothetical protein